MTMRGSQGCILWHAMRQQPTHLPAAHARRSAQHGVQEPQQHAADATSKLATSKLATSKLRRRQASWQSAEAAAQSPSQPGHPHARACTSHLASAAAAWRQCTVLLSQPHMTTCLSGTSGNNSSPQHEHGLGAHHLLPKVGHVRAVHAGAARGKGLRRRLSQPAGQSRVV